MRRILDLNQPSILFLKLIALFGVVIPVALFLGAWALDAHGISTSPITVVICASFLVGVALLAILLGLIILEQIQDHWFDLHYQRHRHQKMLLPDGYYECQYCGNRQVHAQDTTCAVCGRKLS